MLQKKPIIMLIYILAWFGFSIAASTICVLVGIAMVVLLACLFTYLMFCAPFKNRKKYYVYINYKNCFYQVFDGYICTVSEGYYGLEVHFLDAGIEQFCRSAHYIEFGYRLSNHKEEFAKIHRKFDYSKIKEPLTVKEIRRLTWRRKV